jgi:hypothetical protein
LVALVLMTSSAAVALRGRFRQAIGEHLARAKAGCPTTAGS